MKKFLSFCLLLCLACTTYAAGEVHALIMAIGDYRDPSARLQGPAKDVESAKAIARQMGVKEANMRIYRNEELTLDGMTKAVDDLVRRVRQDDQVFIYYSGHGARLVVPDAGGERCAEALVTVDGQGFFDNDFQDRLEKLGKKAAKVIVMLDACHSGGATTRGISSSRNPAFKAKSWQPKDGESACVTPVNVLKRSISPVTRGASSGINNNFVYIAAARDNEVALDNPETGGLATSSWKACLEGGARDLDASGAISAEEVSACAQERIAQRLATASGVSPHHVTVLGNSRMAMKYAPESADPPPAAPVQSAAPVATAPAKPAANSAPTQAVAPISALQAAVLGTGGNAPLAQAGAAKPQVAATVNSVKKKKKRRRNRLFSTTRNIGVADDGASAEDDNGPVATLIDLYSNRDDRRQVTLTTPKNTLRIGKDALEMQLTSSHAGYVYILMVGSDGETFDLLFPNALDKDNRIAAGQALSLPRKGWSLEVQGPEGIDALLAIVADKPLDFSALGMSAAGPFSTVNASSGVTRNLQITTRDSDGQGSYGAAILEIEEVPAR